MYCENTNKRQYKTKSPNKQEKKEKSLKNHKIGQDYSQSYSYSWYRSIWSTM